MADKLKNSLQENLSALIVFNKDGAAALSQLLDIKLFDNIVAQKVVEIAINYYQTYKQPIGDHLPDALEDELSGKQAKLFETYIKNVYELRDNLHPEYVITEYKKFFRQQNLKKSIKEAAELVIAGKVDEAEEVLKKNDKSDSSLFNPGLKFGTKEFLSFLNDTDEQIPTGIKELDLIGCCPTKKELFVFIGLSGMGKSWYLINQGREALLRGKKVLHISLEMPDKAVCKRYEQNFFSISTREESVITPSFKFDTNNDLATISYQQIERPTFKINNIEKFLMKKMKGIRNHNLIVKDFPSGTLTLKHLRYYIESLINIEKFHPDLIMIDYPDLMKQLPGDKKRFSLSDTYVAIRGMGTEYDCAMVAPTQSNRPGKWVPWLDDDNLAEDYSKAGTSGMIVSYNQSAIENMMQIARLLVIKNRNEVKGWKIAITQQYAIGQFCFNSYRMKGQHDNLFKLIDEKESKEGGNKKVDDRFKKYKQTKGG